MIRWLEKKGIKIGTGIDERRFLEQLEEWGVKVDKGKALKEEEKYNAIVEARKKVREEQRKRMQELSVYGKGRRRRRNFFNRLQRN